jgi:hypothetical protein
MPSKTRRPATTKSGAARNAEPANPVVSQGNPANAIALFSGAARFTADDEGREFAQLLLELGEARGVQHARRLLTIDVLGKLQRIKESRAYKRFGLTWAQICEAAGAQVRTVDEEITNLEAFGSDLLDTLREMDLNRSSLRALRSGQDSTETRLVLKGGEIIVGTQRAALEDEKAAEELLAQHIAWLANLVEDAKAAADESRAQLAAAEERHAGELEETAAQIDQLRSKLNQKKVADQRQTVLERNHAEIAAGLAEIVRAYADLLDRCRTEVPPREPIRDEVRAITTINGEMLEWVLRRHRYATPEGFDDEAFDEVERELAAREAAEAEHPDDEEVEP